MRTILVAVLLLVTVAYGWCQQPGDRNPIQDPTNLRRQMRLNLLVKYDANKNGKLEASEKAVWQRDLEQLRANKSAQFDANKDGKLDDAERAAAQAWLTGQTSTPPPQPPAPSQQPRLSEAERKAARAEKNTELVRRHDKDGDGTLSQEEKDALWTEWRAKLREKKAQDGAATTPRR